LTQQQSWVEPDKTVYPLPRVKDYNERLRQARLKLEEEFKNHPSVVVALRNVGALLAEGKRERIF
jgi:hypothetical protein